jgi:hypothetical protein
MQQKGRPTDNGAIPGGMTQHDYCQQRPEMQYERRFRDPWAVGGGANLASRQPHPKAG